MQNKEKTIVEEIDDQAEPEYEFRFLKLNNGDDILCQVPATDVQDLLLVRFPVKVNTMYDSSLDEAVYVFTPWVPFSGQTVYSINKFSVVTITTVLKSVQDVYLQKIEAFKNAAIHSVTPPEETSKESVIPETNKDWVM